MSPRDTREPLLGVGAFLVPLRLGIFSVSNIDDRFQLQVAPLDAVVDFKHFGEDEGRARDGAQHPILAPFHTAGQIELTRPGQQRYGAHFPEIDPHGIVRVEHLFAGALALVAVLLPSIQQIGTFFQIDFDLVSRL